MRPANVSMSLKHNAQMIVFPDVDAVGEKVENAVIGDQPSVRAADMLFFEVIVNLFCRLSVRTQLKSEGNDWNGFLVHNELMVNDLIAERDCAAVPLSLQGVFVSRA